MSLIALCRPFCFFCRPDRHYDCADQVKIRETDVGCKQAAARVHAVGTDGIKDTGKKI
jgi:hypothetical protein